MPNVKDGETAYPLVLPAAKWQQIKIHAATRGETIKDLLVRLLDSELAKAARDGAKGRKRP